MAILLTTKYIFYELLIILLLYIGSITNTLSLIFDEIIAFIILLIFNYYLTYIFVII